MSVCSYIYRTLAIVPLYRRKINTGAGLSAYFRDHLSAKDYLKNYVRSGDNQKFKRNVGAVSTVFSARAYLLLEQLQVSRKAAEAARAGYTLMTTTAE